MRAFLASVILCLATTSSIWGQDADLDSARSAAAAGRGAEALRTAQSILRQRPDDVEALFLSGVLLAEAGRAEEAERAFTRIVQLRPGLPEPHNNLAVLQAARGDYDAALASLRRALETHATYDTAYRNLTKIYGRLAGEAYSKALPGEPNAALEEVDLTLLADLTPSAPAGERSAASRPPESAPAATEPPPQQPAAETPASEADLAAVVRDWAAAWSEKRLADYLDFYSRSFRPDDGSTRVAWEAQRRVRLRRPKWIRVSVAFLDSSRDGDRARVQFIQSYESDTFADTVTKTLELTLEDGRWKIVRESVES